MKGKISKLKDSNGAYQYPVTRAEAVFVNDTTKLSDKLTQMESSINQDTVNYYNNRIQQNYMNKIRVCSYNSESLAEGIPGIQNWLRNKGIHYLGLQEIIFFSGNVSDLKFLDYQDVDIMSYNYGGLQMSVFDTLTSAKYEIQADGQNQRGMSKIETYIHGKKVSLYNTHIRADSTGVQVQYEMNKVLQIMDADPNPYKILTGDFNVVDNSYYDIFLTNYKLCNGKDGVWHDTYKNVAYGTTNAIDNIIVSNNIDILNVVKDIELTLSDHWALYADIVLR